MPRGQPIYHDMTATQAEDFRKKLTAMFNKQHEAAMADPKEGEDPIEARKARAQSAIAATQTVDTLVSLDDYVCKSHLDEQRYSHS